METCDCRTVAQILPIEPHSEEGPTVKRLHDFIFNDSYESADVNEEEYLTTPRAKVQKKLIRIL